MQWGAAVAAAIFVVLAALTIIYGGARVPIAIATAVAMGPGVGFYAAGYRGRLATDWLAVHCDASAKSLGQIKGGRECPPTREFREGQFLTVVACACLAYVIFYYVCALRLAATANDLTAPLILVTVTTSVTVGALGLAAVRYARYIRMITLLKAALEQERRDLRLIEGLHRAAFRDEQLFEPAGSIFVMIGIMATFLGLAAGLANLDLLSFFRGGEQDAVIASLSTFVACMALGLGVSMLGVGVALAAQWLRGNGPSESTDELLQKAGKLLKSLPADGS